MKVSTEATEELINAAAWYEREVSGLGEQLIDTFEQVIIRLGEPNQPLVITKSQVVTVVAFAHHSRKPDFWPDRVTP